MKEAIYKGHGQIESYPTNTALTNIIAHENRHYNFNKYQASIKNENISQEIKLTITFENGKPLPVKAYTEAKITKENHKSEEKFLKLLFISFKISELKKKLSNTKDNKEKLKISFELKKYTEELNNLKKKLFYNIPALPKYKKDHAEFVAIYDYEKFNIPPTILNDPLIDSYKTYKAIQDLYKSQYANNYNNISNILSNKESYKKFLINSWNTLYNVVSDFKTFLSNYKINFYNVTYDGNNIQVSLPISQENLKEKTYTITIDKLAKSFIIYSKKFADIFSALGLEGTPKINGVEINIEKDDSLYDIVQKINWGEDLNKNGVLDYDNGEDINNNQKLDGGTKEHGVFAYIENNTLFLKNIETGDKQIIIEDSNDIFKNFEIIAENPLNNEKYFPNIYQEGQNAEILINNNKLVSESNTIIYDNITIDLKKETTNDIFEIVESTTETYKNIEKFVENYNNLINKLNNLLVNENLNTSLVALKIKRNLKVAMFSDINNYDLTNIGIDLNDEKNFLTSFQIENIQNIDSKKFKNSILDALYNLGITSNEDETLNIDKDKLNNSIKNNKKLISSLFFSKNGLINKLTELSDLILNEKFGFIKNEIESLNSQDLIEIKKNYDKEKIISNYLLDKLENITNLLTIGKNNE